MKIYMEVTNDKYELPLRMANTYREMMKVAKVSRKTLYDSIKGKGNHRRKFVKVTLNEEDE